MGIQKYESLGADYHAHGPCGRRLPHHIDSVQRIMKPQARRIIGIGSSELPAQLKAQSLAWSSLGSGPDVIEDFERRIPGYFDIIFAALFRLVFWFFWFFWFFAWRFLTDKKQLKSSFLTYQLSLKAAHAAPMIWCLRSIWSRALAILDPGSDIDLVLELSRQFPALNLTQNIWGNRIIKSLKRWLFYNSLKLPFCYML